MIVSRETDKVQNAECRVQSYVSRETFYFQGELVAFCVKPFTQRHITDGFTKMYCRGDSRIARF